VREAAARTQCLNNLKQIGLALHSFHDVNKRLPAGAHNDKTPFGTSPTGSEWGSSWIVSILPQIEQAPMFKQLRLNGGSRLGANPPSNCHGANDNIVAVSRRTSTTLPPNAPSPYDGSSTILMPNYVGIAGAAPDALPSEARYSTPNGATGCCSGGILSYGGPLFVGSRVTLPGITDGT